VDPVTHDVVEAAHEMRMDYSQCDVPLLPVFKVVVHEAVQRQALTDSPPAPGGLGYAFYNNRSFAAELARVKASSGARRINTTTAGAAEGWVERTARGARAAEQAGDARLMATSRRPGVVGTAQGEAMAEGSAEAALEATGAVEDAVEAVEGSTAAVEAAAAGVAIEATATDSTAAEGAAEAQATDAVVAEALVEEIEEEIEQGEKQDAAHGDSLEGDSLADVAGVPVDILPA
jgi:hypothetical protein